MPWLTSSHYAQRAAGTLGWATRAPVDRVAPTLVEAVAAFRGLAASAPPEEDVAAWRERAAFGYGTQFVTATGTSRAYEWAVLNGQPGYVTDQPGRVAALTLPRREAGASCAVARPGEHARGGGRRLGCVARAARRARVGPGGAARRGWRQVVQERGNTHAPRVDLAVGCLSVLAVATAACAGERPPPAPPPPPIVGPVPSSSVHASPHDVVGLYTRACDGGSAIGCNDLGLVYFEGRSGARRDQARAASLFQRACDLGAPGGCGNLGMLLHDPGSPMHDEVRALGLLTRACDASWWEGCFWLGNLYFQGEREDTGLAYAASARACQGGGHPKSCASQGVMLQLGKGVAKDGKQAERLLDRSCEAGVPFACTSLGTLLLQGDGLGVDSLGARRAYEKGCSDDYPPGCYVYGTRCASGELGERCDPERPLRHACDRGHANACAALASWMEEAGGGPVAMHSMRPRELNTRPLFAPATAPATPADAAPAPATTGTPTPAPQHVVARGARHRRRSPPRPSRPRDACRGSRAPLTEVCGASHRGLSSPDGRSHARIRRGRTHWDRSPMPPRIEVDRFRESIPVPHGPTLSLPDQGVDRR